MFLEMLRKTFTVTYKAPVGSAVDHYLKGIYIGSRPSIFKDWGVFYSRELGADEVRFRFPIWWGQKIERIRGLA